MCPCLKHIHIYKCKVEEHCIACIDIVYPLLDTKESQSKVELIYLKNL